MIGCQPDSQPSKESSDGTEREMKTYTKRVICCPLFKVINKNKFRWFGNVMRREEESTLRVVMKIKMKGKRPRGRSRRLDNIDT